MCIVQQTSLTCQVDDLLTTILFHNSNISQKQKPKIDNNLFVSYVITQPLENNWWIYMLCCIRCTAIVYLSLLWKTSVVFEELGDLLIANIVLLFFQLNVLFSGAVVVVMTWQFDLQLPMLSVPITTKAKSANPAQTMCNRYQIM